ncbi:UNKNOWN [Stylonychia lemnae]|uniref:Uncharacterized protein n=1 Tax=Stylonychia lemnae TaxID=5949 RepID=A0A078AN76_STYLE|nr:UNKNOWN [Stylonychia lemnae]|eukprot:CDW82807.1 UNKNOWN [Stylonychia lemnae]
MICQLAIQDDYVILIPYIVYVVSQSTNLLLKCLLFENGYNRYEEKVISNENM